GGNHAPGDWTRPAGRSGDCCRGHNLRSDHARYRFESRAPGRGRCSGMDKNFVIELKGVYKVYGNIPRALRQLEQGKDKAFILKEYGHVVALNNLDMAIASGELFVVMGLSGSGKSTLIRMLNALIVPSRGQVLVAGRDILKLNSRELQRFRAHHISMVFQHFG